MTSARHGYARYGKSTYGSGRRQFVGFDAPWFIQTRTGGVRVDGISTSTRVSPIVPGKTIAYDCVFSPQPPQGDAVDDHIERFNAVRELLIRAPDVVTFDPPGTACSYREQHGAPDGTQLVAIGPLASASSGTAPQGELPPVRDSIHNPRWAVVVGGEARSPLPETACMLTLEATTIAPTSEYPTRQGLRDARENNGF